jgi:hypothetical protein
MDKKHCHNAELSKLATNSLSMHDIENKKIEVNMHTVMMILFA